jgi:hypothetical protein
MNLSNLPVASYLFNAALYPASVYFIAFCPSGGTGRHKGLKILRLFHCPTQAGVAEWQTQRIQNPLPAPSSVAEVVELVDTQDSGSCGCIERVVK